jgi:hypothetical protein
MNIKSYPVAYQSAFRPALFVLDEVDAPHGLDVSVLSALGGEALGVKRIYGQGEFAVNIAPYARALLSPQPLCNRSIGLSADHERLAGCRVSTDGLTSDVVYLTAGTCDAPVGSILSAAPDTLIIRTGEKDEISVTTGGGSVKPIISTTHNGTEYSSEIFPIVTSSGMLTFVVDETVIAGQFAAITGLGENDMKEFTVILRLVMSGDEVSLRRHYIVDRTPHRGKRLAWVNRYGAVDYYTFPDTASRTLSGGRGRILSAAGWNAATTETEKWITLTSDYEQDPTLEWLAEILSSPRVWMIEGSVATKVDVADGAVSLDPTRPGNITVKVRPSAVAVSRKL